MGYAAAGVWSEILGMVGERGLRSPGELRTSDLVSCSASDLGIYDSQPCGKDGLFLPFVSDSVI